mmetsp:Transcript_26179/g.37214  ORF Transcript_26179/g.37214 Transcript_26179/m.37214 type:complete len:201 (-) Transcript_26179:374-976(-)
MKILETITRNGGAIEDVDRTETVMVRGMIINERCIFYCHWPQTVINTIFPMERSMEKKNPSTVTDSLNRSFGDTIPMMSVGTTIAYALIMIVYMFDKFLHFESSVIAEIRPNDEAMVKSMLFKSLFCLNSFDGRKSKLMFDVNVSGSMIDENAATNVLVRRRFSFGVVGAAWKTRFEVIDRDFSTRNEMVSTKSTGRGRD